ncbi:MULTISPECIES: CSS-motif domain-containing protein [Pseudomonas]|jgi:hypothetical protein|uniref:CSS-motif domain-containing protein n=1 Tax=Pseudomonas TaxID=286 RepID=UPI0018D8BD50|nr:MULTISPECIES: CSS-motif domain-containing protein [Pseudomonas]MBH3373719.1 CSS-motif domain-containing protein [Pseudomonas juntendi]MBS6037055.1 CSS-motif domain-containing protein [Pseudomonas sp.]CAH0646423.1 hypothetical protein PSNVIR_00689 [Pseudomonas sp. Nvir]
MSYIVNAGRSMLELLLLIVVGLVPVVSGLLVMILQLQTKLAENAAVSVKEAVYSVDQAFNRMQETALRSLPLAGQPCASALNTLQDHVTSLSMLRSLTLVEGEQAYCSTTPDPLEDLTAFATSGRQVEISYGLADTRRKLLVNLYTADNNQGVIVTAYASQLRSELDAFQDGLTLLLEFDDRYLWSGGDSRAGARPSQDEFSTSMLSQKYGYRVVGGYAEGFTAREIRQSMRQTLPSLLLVGVLTASVVFLALMKGRASRRSRAAEGT